MKFILVLIVLGTSLPLAAQTKAKKYSFRSSEKIVKFNISEMFSLTPAFGVEVESKFDEQSSLLFGVGIVPSFFQPLTGNQGNSGFNNFVSINNNGYDYLRGYQMSVGGRLYASRKPARYVSFDANFRHLIIRDKDVLYGLEPFGNNNNNGWNNGWNGNWGAQYEYTQSVDMLFHQFRIGWDTRFGFQKNVGTHFVFDFNLGARLETTVVQSRSEVPEGGTLIRNWSDRLYLQDILREQE